MLITKDKALVYSSSDCVITPYPTEVMLAQAFMMMENDGLTDQVFHEGNPGLGWFVNEFSKKNAILMCWVRTGPKPADLTLAGMTWFNGAWRIGRSEFKKAEVGICFFKKFWRRKWTITLAALSAEWAFDNLEQGKIVLLMGTTPEPNKAAVAFFKALGFGTTGLMPCFTTYPGIEGPVGIWGSYMTREVWTIRRDEL